MAGNHMEHRTSTLEQVFRSPPAKVFNAWSDLELRQKWNSPSEDIEIEMHQADFSEGGKDVAICMYEGHAVAEVIAIYHEIVEDSRIIFTEAISSEGAKQGASLVSVAFLPENTGTRLVVTLQTVAVDGSELLDEVLIGWKEAFVRMVRLVP